jgi:restriction system protein
MMPPQDTVSRRTLLRPGPRGSPLDLLTRKNGLTYAIQCKFYSTPVGVGAVQEVAAGLVHYVADCAVVVALSGFTTAARRLAESTSVLLIGSGQLSNMEELALPLI